MNANANNQLKNMSDFGGKRFGFIGLGAMGKPMVENLVNKLSEVTRISVYDVDENVIDEVHSQYSDRIIKAQSSKKVTEESVRVKSMKSTCLC